MSIIGRGKRGAQHQKPWFVFQWHITDACDQRCKHCYIYAEDRNRPVQEMSRQQLRDTLARCVRFCGQLDRAPSFAITGGDPLLHPDFMELAGWMHQLGVPFSVMGNPFHLTGAVCRKLKRLGCTFYQMSVDGTEKTHDAMRKPGSYRETLEKIALLNRNGLRSAVMTTVSRVNMAELPEVIRAMSEAGVGTYAFSRYCPTSEEKTTGITPREYRELLETCAGTIRGLQEKGSKTRFVKKDHLWVLYDYERGKLRIPEHPEPGVILGGCHCGSSHLTILPDGDIYACRRVLNSRVGNVLQDSLAAVWTGPMNAYREYERFEKCAACELLARCRGCPAVAAAHTGSFYGADPQCWKEIG